MSIHPDLYKPVAPDTAAEAQAPANDPAPRESDPLLGAEAREMQPFILREKVTREQLRERFPSRFEKLLDSCIEMGERLVKAEATLSAAGECLGRLEGRIVRLEGNLRPPYGPFVEAGQVSHEEALSEALRRPRILRFVRAPEDPHHDIDSDSYVFPNGVKIAAVVLYQLGLWQAGDKPLSVAKSESGYVYLLANT